MDCLKFGGSYCQLNYEARKSYDIVVRVTDNGTGNLSNQFKVTVYVKDINDQPRSLTISNSIVSTENVMVWEYENIQFCYTAQRMSCYDDALCAILLIYRLTRMLQLEQQLECLHQLMKMLVKVLFTD